MITRPGRGARAEIRDQVAAAEESFRLRPGQVFGKLVAGTGAHGARSEFVVLYADKKKENAGLEAYIKCAQQGENRHFQVYFAHFLRAF